MNSINLYDHPSPRFFVFLAHKTTIKASQSVKQTPHFTTLEDEHEPTATCSHATFRSLGIMRIRQLPYFVAICCLLSSVGAVKDGPSSSLSNHRQYVHTVDVGSSVSYGAGGGAVGSGNNNKNSKVSTSSGAAAASFSGSGESGKSFSSSGGSSLEYGGAAEGTSGSFHSLVSVDIIGNSA